MKNSNFIAESVFKVNLHYSKLQNKTKELFFKCLNENKSSDYFKKELNNIWGVTNYKLLDKEIKKYTEIIHFKNTGKKETVLIKTENMIFPLTSNDEVIFQENKFKAIKVKEYYTSQNSYGYETDKETYLKNKVNTYNNQTVPYYFKGTNLIQRHVQLSTYNAMLHNVNLTRAGWNTTIQDGDDVGNKLYWIPYHPFSCPDCLYHQNEVYTKEDLLSFANKANKGIGDILHPNCKCEITFYDNDTVFNRPDYTDAELNEQYDIRQKVNSLTLKKEEVLTDIKIQTNLGNQDEVDKLNQYRNKINKSIRDLKDKLPTDSLKKQVVAIYR